MSITLIDQDKTSLRVAAYGAVTRLSAAGAAGSSPTRPPPRASATGILEENCGEVSDRGGGVRSRGVRLPEEWPGEQEMISMAQSLLSEPNDTDALATDAEQAAIDVFNGRMQADSHCVFASRLGGCDTAIVVDSRDGGPVFTAGPYLE
ncbi:hypothetical protein [Micromonospora chersina]|uniref:hypothetical protein n=1 Tax=Micromonospora chersina TaxID=47854 RepID=UPI0033D87202